jgi:hypothetical protein
MIDLISFRSTVQCFFVLGSLQGIGAERLKMIVSARTEAELKRFLQVTVSCRSKRKLGKFG